jgi:hypothetical protein
MEILCQNVDCPIYYKRIKVKNDLANVRNHMDKLNAHTVAFWSCMHYVVIWSKSSLYCDKSHLEGIFRQVFQIVSFGIRQNLVYCLHCLSFYVCVLAFYLNVWHLHLFQLRIFQVDYQFVHSAKLVGVYCVVLKPLQIGRN